ncbi:MAG: hypothetical protein ACTSWW_07970 [Promethearchaeota archaeon]
MPIASEIYEKVQILPSNFQYQVLSFVRTLETLTQEGNPGKDLLKFAGTIPLEDLNIMRETIEAGCEQVDLNEW